MPFLINGERESSMQASYNHPLFGPLVYSFEGTENDYKRGAEIEFSSGFDPADVTKVYVPQMVGIEGLRDGRFWFHKQGHAQLKMAFAELQRLDLMKHVVETAGSLYQRLRKPYNDAGKEVKSILPSNHSFGIAVDLNPHAANHGETTAPLAPIFLALGFTWGVTFNDPMHFEVAQFIADPQPVTPEELAACEQLAMQQLQAYKDRLAKARRHSRGIAASHGIVASDSMPESEEESLWYADEHDDDASA